MDKPKHVLTLFSSKTGMLHSLLSLNSADYSDTRYTFISELVHKYKLDVNSDTLQLNIHPNKKDSYSVQYDVLITSRKRDDLKDKYRSELKQCVVELMDLASSMGWKGQLSTTAVYVNKLYNNSEANLIASSI